ncbi:MAG: formyltransferase family protein [Patescibacteria group bacterium]|nr:formyltransferase family protein [Patescibacteria group bacterium]
MLNGLLRVALLISGGGTTAREILRACKDGRLPHVHPTLMIASKPDAGGIQKALAEGMSDKDIVVIRPKRGCPGSPEFGEAILAECRKRDVDFVGQYGWLPVTPGNVIEAYQDMIVNQHPGPLDPERPPGFDFGGDGMYGRRVHCARLYFVRKVIGDYWTEAVSHRVVTKLDRGAVVNSARIEILPTDDVVSLQESVLPIEHSVQVGTLRMFSEGTVKEIRRDEPLIHRAMFGTLKEAKRLAIMLWPQG